MPLTCEVAQQLAGNFSLVRHCDQLPNGILRIATPFQYPNGSGIDLFVGEAVTSWFISDLGQTTEYLLDLRVKLWTTNRRKQAVAQICESLGVEKHGGEFRIQFEPSGLPDLPQYIVRLAQACLRASDLALTRRVQGGNDFREDLEEFFDALSLPYETPVTLRGRFDQLDVEIDYLVTGHKVKSLAHTLSPGKLASVAHAQGNEVLRRWIDLAQRRQEYQFVTVFDTTSEAFREADLARLEQFSAVVGFPAEAETLKAVLVA